MNPRCSREFKVKPSLRLFMIAQFLITLCHLTFASATSYVKDQGVTLESLQLNDAYQGPDAASGILLFLYRELSTCSPQQTCLRLALAWLSPDGRAIELNIDESQLDASRLKRQTGGTGLTSGNILTIEVPPSLRATLGDQLILKTEGRDGELLGVRSISNSGSRPTETLGLFQRVQTAAHPVATLSQLRARLRNPLIYHPLERPKLEEREYTVFATVSDTGWIDGALASIPVQNRSDSNWQLATFALSHWLSSSKEPTFILSKIHGDYQQVGHTLELRKILYSALPASSTQPLTVNTVPLLNNLWMSARPTIYVPGIGRIRLANAKEILHIEQNRAGNLDNVKFGAVNDAQLAEFVVRQYSEKLIKLEQKNTHPDPFLDSLARAGAGTCNAVLDPNLPSSNATGRHQSVSPGGGAQRMPPIRD